MLVHLPRLVPEQLAAEQAGQVRDPPAEVQAGLELERTGGDHRALLAGQVKRDSGDDDLRQRSRRPPEPDRGPVMEDAVPPVPDNDLRENHGECQVGRSRCRDQM